MRSYFIKISSVIFFSFIILSCSAKQNLKPNINHEVYKETELPAYQWREWNRIKEKWLKNTYRKCSEKFNLKMSCSGCEYIYIKAELYIDNNGKMYKYRIIKENVCGNNAPGKYKKCLMDYFKNIIFPVNLRNLVIESFLGNGLKC